MTEQEAVRRITAWLLDYAEREYQSKLNHMQAGRKLVARDRDIAAMTARQLAAAIERGEWR